MLEIQNTLVSLDLVERFFCCDLASCLGQCCIDGDAGAPVTPDEVERLREVLPEIWNDLSPAAQRVIQEQGVAYTDEEGDLVTSIVNGRDCVFTCYAPGGLCLCAIEKAYREGRVGWRKPSSCALYPVRLHRRQPPPLENMQMRRGARAPRGHTRLRVPQRAAHRALRRGLVRRTRRHLRRVPPPVRRLITHHTNTHRTWKQRNHDG